MAKSGDSNNIEGMLPVSLPSGARFLVHEDEYQYFHDRSQQYLTDNDFQNVSDFQDVDRLLILELMVYRNGLWSLQLQDYWGEPVDEEKLQKLVKDHSAEIRQLKKNLGLDRETREKLRGEDSVENYLARLRQRAHHFGYKRNDEAAKAMELWKTLESIVVLHLNCTERERIEQQVTTDDIIKWLTEEAFPAYNAIDIEFRKEQKMWIREM